MTEIKPGDVVRVKAPQPKAPIMTVDRVHDSLVECVWFNHFDLKRDTFSACILEKVTLDADGKIATVTS